MAARVLFVRSDHLGDVLLTLGAAALLRRADPAVRITYLVGPAGADVPAHCPDVDETLVETFPPVGAAWDGAAWADEARRIGERLRNRFDAALVLHPFGPWGAAAIAAAGVPVRLGFDLPDMRPYLTHAQRFDRRHPAVRMAVDLTRAAARLLNIDLPDAPVPPGWFVPTDADEADARAALLDDAAPIVLHPGSGWAIKNWPRWCWARLAGQLARRHATRPLVIAGPGEQRLAGDIVAGSGGRATAPAAALSLGALAAVHRRARLVVATDSGPLHLAALMGAPVVGLYGPADPLVFAPPAPARRRRQVWAALPCRPCNRLDDPPCAATSTAACVRAITVEAVLAACDELLSPTPA